MARAPSRSRSGTHRKSSQLGLYLVLGLFALAFVFPFWFMAVGAFQANPTNSPTDLLPTGGWTLQNFVDINARLDLARSLLNSLIFTLGVLAGTLTFGLAAGYSLSRLHWRGRGALFAIMLGVQAIPFQLLMIPLYVQVTRIYGLGDSYLGMILPFLINTTAVFIFRQFFLSLPESLFEAARIDGASELRILFSVAVPLVKPAIATVALTGTVSATRAAHTSAGPPIRGIPCVGIVPVQEISSVTARVPAAQPASRRPAWDDVQPFERAMLGITTPIVGSTAAQTSATATRKGRTRSSCTALSDPARALQTLGPPTSAAEGRGSMRGRSAERTTRARPTAAASAPRIAPSGNAVIANPPSPTPRIRAAWRLPEIRARALANWSS